MYITDNCGNPIDLQHAADLLNCLYEFLALVAVEAVQGEDYYTLLTKLFSKNNTEQDQEYKTIKTYGVSTFSSDMYPEIEVGRLWRFLMLDTELYKNFCYTIGNQIIDFSRYDTGLENAYQSYNSKFNDYK